MSRIGPGASFDRIPDINEFVDGFEYAVWSDGHNEESVEDHVGWYRYNFRKGSCWRGIDDIKIALERDEIRAKGRR